jgi:hypothetical protein
MRGMEVTFLKVAQEQGTQAARLLAENLPSWSKKLNNSPVVRKKF